MQTFTPRGNIRGFIMPTHVFYNHSLGLSLAAKVLYAVFCNYAAHKDHCWPSHKTLAALLGYSVSTIKKLIGELEKAKLIAKKPTAGASIYYMLLPEGFTLPCAANKKENYAHEKNSYVQQKGAQPNSTAQHQYAPQSKTTYPQPKTGYINTSINKNIHTHKQHSASTPSKKAKVCAPSMDFEKVWEAYPKKCSKGFAREAWAQLSQNGELPPTQTLLTAIEHFAACSQWQKEGGRFIPFLGKWLKGHYWLHVQDAVQALAQEAERRRAQEERFHAHNAQEQELRHAQQSKKDQLRPEFELFAARFVDYEAHAHRNAMLFGKWLFLEKKVKAPRSEDVPQDNTLSITAFLDKYQHLSYAQYYQISEKHTEVRQACF